mmetsp:Transcript_1932/g.4974  ORF Transcript_1932/g.4974 Transcript_1932/m.4974 type:complete len:219 (+) Transcript_1932:251-907(+)
MMKSPAVSAAPPAQSAAASAPSPMASPTPPAASPKSAIVASQPSSAMCSPSTAPATASPPTAATPPTPAATLAPVDHSLFFSAAGTGAAAGAAAGANGGGASGPISGTGTSMACPTRAVAGTATWMKWPGADGCGTWIVVPGPPGGTVTQVVGPGAVIGVLGAVHRYGGRISRRLPVFLLTCSMFLKSTSYALPLRLYRAFGKPARKARLMILSSWCS